MSADERTVYWLSLTAASAATLLRLRALDAGLEWRRTFVCEVSKVTVELSLHAPMPATSTERQIGVVLLSFQRLTRCASASANATPPLRDKTSLIVVTLNLLRFVVKRYSTS